MTKGDPKGGRDWLLLLRRPKEASTHSLVYRDGREPEGFPSLDAALGKLRECHPDLVHSIATNDATTVWANPQRAKGWHDDRSFASIRPAKNE
jgi:hypothetical protein